MELSVPRPDIQELIERCLVRDRRAYKELFEEFAPKMLPLCIRYMRNREDAEDVLQDGFITLFNQIDRYEGRGSFEGWVRRIFVTTALMHLRKKDPLKISDDITEVRTLGDMESSAIQRLEHKELLRLVSGLPAGFRVVFNLYVIEGYSHKEISDMLGISEATSRSQLSRARFWLQQKIKENENDRERIR